MGPGPLFLLSRRRNASRLRRRRPHRAAKRRRRRRVLSRAEKYGFGNAKTAPSVHPHIPSVPIYTDFESVIGLAVPRPPFLRAGIGAPGATRYRKIFVNLRILWTT